MGNIEFDWWYEISRLLFQAPMTYEDLCRSISSRYSLPLSQVEEKVRLQLDHHLDNPLGFYVNGQLFKLSVLYVDYFHADVWHFTGSNYSGLHDWLVKTCSSLVDLWHVAYKYLPSTTVRRDADIVLNAFNIEVETGKKKDFSRLKSRILTAGKDGIIVVIVVPNLEIKGDYEKHFVGIENSVILSIEEFSRKLRLENLL